MISPARWTAFEALRQSDVVHGSGRDLASALADARRHLRDPRDRALTTELALGVERWRGALDAIIAASSGREIASIDFPVLLSLRLATFQLKFLTRTPAHAVVDDAVEMVKGGGAARATGFVNAVLRGLIRHGLDAGLPPRPDNDDDGAWMRYLSTALSQPGWLAERMVRRHGAADAEAWAVFNNAAAPLTVRVNTRRMPVDAARAQLESEGVTTEPASHAPGALIVTSGNPMASALHDLGAIALMDETSQLVGALAAGALAGTVLDACAAPGGKTMILASDLPEGSRVIAADRRPRRLSLLGRSLRRFGLDDVPMVRHDLSRGVPFAALDGIFVDAPCSGLGTIRRDPDIKWRRREGDLMTLAASQREMLRQAARAVRPGGRIVYATCSSEPEENEDVVEAFLAEHPRAGRAPIEGVRLAPFLDDRGDFRTLPHRDGLEAFFAAVVSL